MLSTDQINDLYRLYWSERWPIRKIERHLRMGWRTIKKYLDAPAQGPAKRQRTSQLDPFKATIAEWLTKDPTVTAAVIEPRLRPLGYAGSHSILRECVQKLRPQLTPQRAFIRLEPAPCERFEVDWAHFGSLEYSGDKRKLYAFALVDAHSRMLYLEFTHSQSFETFVRCHVHAFEVLQGVAREMAYDNLATAMRAANALRLIIILTPARVWEWLQHGKMQLATCRQLAVYRKSRRDVQDFGEQVLLDARWPHGAGVRRHPHIDPFFKTVPSNPFTAIFHLHIQRSWEDSVNPCPCPGKIGILVGLHIVREILCLQRLRPFGLQTSATHREPCGCF